MAQNIGCSTEAAGNAQCSLTPSQASVAVREAGWPLQRELCAALTREQLQGSMS